MNEEKNTVLVVDDTFYIRVMIRKALEPMGLEIIEAEDGFVAEEKFKQHEDHLGLVICDIGMPNRDGVETLAELRKINQEIPIIMLTAQSTERHLVECARLGISGFYAKPIDPKMLRSKVHELLHSAPKDQSIAILDTDLQFRILLKECIDREIPGIAVFGNPLDMQANFGEIPPRLILMNLSDQQRLPIMETREKIYKFPGWQGVQIVGYFSKPATEKLNLDIGTVPYPFQVDQLTNLLKKFLANPAPEPVQPE